jgi:hypothetical protein
MAPSPNIRRSLTSASDDTFSVIQLIRGPLSKFSGRRYSLPAPV